MRLNRKDDNVETYEVSIKNVITPFADVLTL